MTELGPIKKARRSGQEPFRASGQSIAGADVLDFWRWSFSDLVSNATRGVLAEYLVGKALGCREQVRVEWAPYDLTTPDGITVEVKSAAYIQSWHQNTFSQICFDTRTTTAWSEADATYDKEPKRQAQVYVFALLAHKDQATLDPFNLDHWIFYVLPTAVLNEKLPTQKKVSLSRLIALGPEATTYSGLPAAVGRAAGQAPIETQPKGAREMRINVFASLEDPKNAVERFIAWQRENPSGFVLNRKTESKGMLHKVGCWHLGDPRDGVPDWGELTRKAKVCDNDREVLLRWANAVGVKVEDCRTCIR